MSFRSFGMIMWNQNMVKKQNFMFIVYIEIDVIYRDITEDGYLDLILQVMNYLDHCQKKK